MTYTNEAQRNAVEHLNATCDACGMPRYCDLLAVIEMLAIRNAPTDRAEGLDLFDRALGFNAENEAHRCMEEGMRCLLKADDNIEKLAAHIARAYNDMETENQWTERQLAEVKVALGQRGIIL